MIYDFKCKKCGEIKNDILCKTSEDDFFCECGEKMTQQIGAAKLGNMSPLGRSKPVFKKP